MHIPSQTKIENLKLLVLYSQDDRTAKQMLADIIHYNYLLLNEDPTSSAITLDILTAMQVFYEFELEWDDDFDSLLESLQVDPDDFKQQLNGHAMHLIPSYKNLQKLFIWHDCRKNPLLPNKKEVLAVIYQICRTSPNYLITYHFDDGKHTYRLSWKKNGWELHEQNKSLTWYL